MAPYRWLIPLLLLTFWLGARSLDADAIWLDEYFSLFDAGAGPYGPLTPAENWARVAERNPWHAPGFFVLLNGWGRLVGYEPAAQRAFSLYFGVLAVASAYQLGQTLVSRHVGLYGAGVLATSAFFVYYTHEIRMYTLIAFLTVATLLVYFRLVEARARPSSMLWLAWFGCCVAVLYTHYLAAVPLAALGLYHLLFARKNRRWWLVTIIASLAGIAFLPWGQHLMSGLGLASDAETLHDRALSTRRLLELVGTLFGNGSLVLVGVTALLALTDTRRRVLRLWFLALVPLGLFVLLNRQFQIIPETRIRYLLSLWPLFALLVGVALTRLRRWPALPLAGLAVWAAVGITSAGSPAFVSMLASAGYVFPLHHVDDVMREYGEPGDAIVYFLSDDMARITYERQADFYTRWRGLRAVIIEPKADEAARAEERRAALAALDGSERVWLAYVPLAATTGRDQLTETLRAQYIECRPLVSVQGLRVDLYAVAPEACV